MEASGWNPGFWYWPLHGQWCQSFEIGYIGGAQFLGEDGPLGYVAVLVGHRWREQSQHSRDGIWIPLAPKLMSFSPNWIVNVITKKRTSYREYSTVVSAEVQEYQDGMPLSLAIRSWMTLTEAISLTSSGQAAGARGDDVEAVSQQRWISSFCKLVWEDKGQDMAVAVMRGVYRGLFKVRRAWACFCGAAQRRSWRELVQRDDDPGEGVLESTWWACLYRKTLLPLNP